MILILGYIYFMVYSMFILLVGGLFIRRLLNQRKQVSQASRILSSIPRVKFNEDLFGAISEENECIICMT